MIWLTQRIDAAASNAIHNVHSIFQSIEYAKSRTHWNLFAHRNSYGSTMCWCLLAFVVYNLHYTCGDVTWHVGSGKMRSFEFIVRFVNSNKYSRRINSISWRMFTPKMSDCVTRSTFFCAFFSFVLFCFRLHLLPSYVASCFVLVYIMVM